MDTNAINIKDLGFNYIKEENGNEIEIDVLHDINFQVAQGEFVCILGGNGSGKSTLAKIIDGILEPSTGNVIIYGKNSKDKSLIWDIHKDVGMVFQNPDNQIVANIVEEDVAFGLENLGFENIFTSDMHRAAHTAELILSKNLYMKKTKIKQDQRIREWCFGSMEGESNSQLLGEIKKVIGDVSFEQINHYLPQIAEYIVNHDTTGWAESFEVIQKRLNSFFDDIVNNYSGGNFLVVTHAFLIRTIIYLYGYDKLEQVSKIENASVTKLEYINGKFNITEINNTDYIK